MATPVLMTVNPAGPACHTGTTSCFDGAGEGTTLGSILERLQGVVAKRAEQRPKGSYTVELLDGGVDRVARKVLEEAGELAFSAKDHAAGVGSSAGVAEEAADVLYHLLVLLRATESPHRTSLVCSKTVLDDGQAAVRFTGGRPSAKASRPKRCSPA